MKIKKYVIIALILGVAIFAAFKLFGNKKATIQYQTVKAEKGNLISTVTGSGSVSSGNSVDLTTSATGVIKNVYVKNGDKVVKGQKLADITLDQDSNQKYLSAYASYLSAQNNLKSAQVTLYSLDSTMWSVHEKFRNDAQQRNLTVDDPTYIQENDDWLAAENKVINQQAVITQAKVSVQSAYINYIQASSVIYAPITGTISNLNMAPGLLLVASTTSNSNQTPLQTVGTITVKQGQMQASINLTEIDVTQVQTNQKATVTLDAFPDKTFAGKVLAINTNGQTSSGVTTYPTTIVFDTDLPNIYPNMSVNANIITDIRNDVVLVPNAAVQTSNGQTTIRTLKNGKEVDVQAEIGKSNTTQTEVTSGINEGDTIITGTTGSSTTARSTGTTTSVFGGLGGGRGIGGGAAFGR
jgi:RND family efflux transporter MFP subunit